MKVVKSTVTEELVWHSLHDPIFSQLLGPEFHVNARPRHAWQPCINSIERSVALICLKRVGVVISHLLDRSGESFLASPIDTGSYSSFCLVKRLLAFRMGKVAPTYLANPVLYH
jgi:hypothetical protein